MTIHEPTPPTSTSIEGPSVFTPTRPATWQELVRQTAEELDSLDYGGSAATRHPAAFYAIVHARAIEQDRQREERRLEAVERYRAWKRTPEGQAHVRERERLLHERLERRRQTERELDQLRQRAAELERQLAQPDPTDEPPPA